MKYAIMTIPHTGTHFVLNLLGGTRDNLKDWMNTKFNANGNDYYVSHNYRLPIYEMMESMGYIIVTPIRHPLTTVRSWIDRYKKEPIPLPDDIHSDTYVIDAEKYVNPDWVPNLYKSLITIDDLYDVNYIPIDSPYREEYLRKFNARYNLELTTQWRPLNSHGETTYDIPPELLAKTAEMMQDNRDFFKRFYDE